ncbi:MAG TPA: FAD-binding oxidoreductase [Steroidobacter sp.]|uniref:NAD(P)/FAD-dependent oxidoreductase n=1 Tax=Steroidobacter sp. TaxID=1978227 RepID=UPI002EDA2D26
MPEALPVVVIGAGVAGLSVAVHLQRLGRKVVVIDRLEPPGGASFGNCGFISPNSCIPASRPGMMRHVPRWLSDPEGPLRIDPSYALRAAPWLMRWMLAGRSARRSEVSAALNTLHQTTWEEWRTLLGAQSFNDLMRPSAVVSLTNLATDGPLQEQEKKLEERFGIKRETIGRAEIREMFPGISEEVARGVVLPPNGYVVSTTRLFRTLAQIFREAGGQIVYEDVQKVIPSGEGNRWIIMTNAQNHIANDVVIAAGVWSARLLSPLGVRVPLQSQRGYHVMLPAPSLELRHGLIHREFALGITPMEEGLRVGGTIEFAGLDAAPDERRAIVLHKRAVRVFPELRAGRPSWWMGHRPSLPDELPALGPIPGHPGLHACFGHGMSGLSGGPLSGRLVAELVVGRQPALDLSPYSITRF